MTTTIYIPVGEKALDIDYDFKGCKIIDGVTYRGFTIEPHVLDLFVKGLQPDSDIQDNFMSDQDEKKKLVDDFLSYRIPSGVDIMQYLNRLGKAPKDASDWKGEYILTADEMVEMLTNLQGPEAKKL